MYKSRRREISIKSLMAVLRRLSYSVTLGVMFVVVINAEDSSKNRKANDLFIKGSSAASISDVESSMSML